MKKTDKKCFASSKAMMIWQENNCMNCKKAVWYNTRLSRMPKYRCAVQRQIEEQEAAEAAEVTQRTFDAVQNNQCPFFAAKEEANKADTEVLNFSDGECIAETIKTREKQEETANKASKGCAVDRAYLEVARKTGASLTEIAEAEQRMWETINKEGLKPSIVKSLSEVFNREFRRKEKSIVDIIKSSARTTTEDIIRLATIPLIISHIAWGYAENIRKYCVANRIHSVIKLTRAIKQLKEEYNQEMRLSLDGQHESEIAEMADEFKKQNKFNFYIMQLQCKNNIRAHQAVIDEAIQIDAYCAAIFVEVLKRHNKAVQSELSEKTGQRIPDLTNRKMIGLKELMEGFFPVGFKIELDKNIGMCINTILNAVKQIEMEVTTL